MNELKEFWKAYSPYSVDFWMYLIFLLGTLIAALIFL